MSSKIIIINGPNLNLLGSRDVEVYGASTLKEIEALCERTGLELGYECVFFQSNLEGAIVDCLQAHLGSVAGILINPAGFSHTSVAIRDALELCSCPVIEVHLSNLAKREAFRQISLTAAVVTGVVSGLGALGYRVGLIGLADLIEGGEQS